MLPIDLVERVKNLPADQVPNTLAEVFALLVARLVEAGAKAVPASACELLDAPALAKRLGVHESWIRREYRRSRIPGKRFGRYIRFDPAVVEAALAALPEASMRIPGRTRRRSHVV